MKALLFIPVSFAVLTAILSGLIMINNPDGNIMNLRLNLPERTAFKDLRIPGLILAIVDGGINLLAVFYNPLRYQTRYNWAMVGGTVISG
jgi:hypothetical protein